MKSAYPQTQNPVSIRLYANIPFDNTYEHHSLISEWFRYNGSKIYDKAGVTACESFIDRKKYALTPNPPFYYPRWDMTDTYNFDFQNGLVGSVTLELTPEQTNANYMRVTCGSDVYYYFITGIKQVNFETYTLTLELDVIMTYQDEFLEGVKDIPMMTDRKHCHRFNSAGYPHCPDLKSGENIFAGIKPSVVKDKQQLHFKDTNMKKLENIIWMYVCCDVELAVKIGDWQDDDYVKELQGILKYQYHGVKYPLMMICLPMNVDELTITGYVVMPDQSHSSITARYTQKDINEVINVLVGNGLVHSCKLSPYPPFNLDGYTCTVNKNAKIYTIDVGEMFVPFNTGWPALQTSKSKLQFFRTYPQHTEFPDKLFMVILEEYKDEFEQGDVELPDMYYSNISITANRKTDPKLLFEPFRKYLLTATYSNGNEFFPELIYSDGVYKSNAFDFNTINTTYIGDYNVFTYQKKLYDYNNKAFYKDYKENGVGLMANINYTIPCGLDALDVFNSTQAQSFYQSKVASGITSGLTIAGGIGSIALGVAGTIGSLGMGAGAGAGLIIGGASAVAGGIASLGNTIKSTNAKVEDLKNTPDSVNVLGGCPTSDLARETMFPFVSIYECCEMTKEQANDFFYNYGYQVARDCYFNTELSFNNDSDIIDNNIFGRTIFNYVKINEDITNKINANIPQVIKQKLS